MPLVEGIGDEVIEFFIGLIIILIAWWSTRIADRPFIRTVLVFERRSQNRTNTNTNTSTHNNINRDEQQNQRNYVQELSPVAVEGGATVTQHQTEPGVVEIEENKPSSTMGTSVEHEATSDQLRNEDGSGDQSTATAIIHDEQNAIVQNMDSDSDSEACVLRRRRLEFFHNRPDTLARPVEIDNNNQITVDETMEELNGIKQNANSSSTESINTTETTIDENDIRIKLKYINDDLKLVNGKLLEPLGDFKRRHFQFELANDKLVRLIFNGQVLQRDDLSLQNCGMFDNCVVHCLVHQKRNNPDGSTTPRTNFGSNVSSASENSRARIHNRSSTQRPGREWDLGNLFFAIVSFVLGAAWYFRYEYAQLYTVTATVALVGLTGIFTVLLVGMYFPDPEPPIQSVRS